MTILIDIRPLTDEKYSGVGEYTFRLLTALLERDSENRYILFYNAFRDVSHRLPDFSKYKNVKVIRRGFPNKIFNYALLWLFGRPRFDKLAKEKVDVFFMPHTNFVAFSKNIKSVIAIHDLSFLTNPEFFSWRKNVWHWFINVPRLVRRFDKVIAVSDHTKKDLIEVAGLEAARAAYIYSGLDEKFKKLPGDDPGVVRVREKYGLGKSYVLFLSTLEPRKNVEGLVEAFNALKQSGRYEELQLVLAGGRGWKSAPIFKSIEASPFRDSIIVLDYVDEADRPYLYNAASVFAYPSFYEGFGFPPLEAMACGTPVVAGAASSLPEIVGDAAILIDPYNPAALSLALDQVLSDTELAAELAKKGEARAKAFSWQKAAEEYLRIFSE